MVTVNDVRKFLDEQWTVLLWSDAMPEGGFDLGEGFYYALAICPTETTQHAMEQEKQLAKGDTPSEALRCLVEKMGGRSIATGTLLEVAAGLVEWDDELERVGNQSRPPRVIVDKARMALELAKRKRPTGD